MRTFWEKLPTPFFALAPMEDVTDAAFRRLIATCGKPDVMLTEFTSADGLVRADAQGQRKLRKRLVFSEGERPLVAQLFTSVPEHMAEAARQCAELGVDGIDINMGCPDRAIEKSGCGAALIKDPALARALIRAAKESGLPVSVKTRLGYRTDELETWLPELLSEDPAAVTIHARTRQELSDVPAHWDRVARAVLIRNELQNPRGDTSLVTRIIGNGDVRDLADAREKAAATGCDGVMLGRAVFGNPWLFADVGAQTPRQKMDALSRHLALFDELLGDTTHFAVMKKHFKAYISGWDNAKEVRMRLMETENVAEAQSVLQGAL